MGDVTQTPLVIPLRGPFQPRFLMQNETAGFGLPDGNRQPNILALVDGASTLIDQYCGRTDGWGQGSLIYSTYMERITLQARGRNITRVSFKPMVGIDANTVNTLMASANAPINTDLIHASIRTGSGRESKHRLFPIRQFQKILYPLFWELRADMDMLGDQSSLSIQT